MMGDGEGATAALHLTAADESCTAPAVKQQVTSELVVSPNLQSKKQRWYYGGNTLLTDSDQVDALMNLVQLTPQVASVPHAPHSTLAPYSSVDTASYTSPPPVCRTLATTGGVAAAFAHPGSVHEPGMRADGGRATAAQHSTAADASRTSPPAKRAAPGPVGTDLQRKKQRKKQRRNYGEYALSADQVEALMGEDNKARPPILDTVATPQAECGGWVFREKGKSTRPADPRADRWRRGGGAGGASDLPNPREPRVRRRYGYVIPAGNGLPRLRYHQYCRLIPAKSTVDGEPSECCCGQSDTSRTVKEDVQVWLYHVLPPEDASPVQAPASSLAGPTPAPPTRSTAEPAFSGAALGIAKQLLAAFDGNFPQAVECLLTALKFA